MAHKGLFIGVLACCLLLLGGSVHADEVMESINEAADAYNEKEY